MLAHQLPLLPSFDQFWLELPAVFKWLYSAVEKTVRPSIPVMGVAIDKTWRPPAMATAWYANAPLEAIRFAGANRLCVDLTYNNTHRLIEPYSLRQTMDGKLLLYAVKHQTGEDRSYRVDRIQDANVTKVPFSPRYSIELTASGPMSAPPTAHKLTGLPKSKLMGSRIAMGHSRKGTPTLGSKYVFQCPLCGKQFTHNSQNTLLNKHKNKQGYPCPGRTGIYMTTRY